MAKRVAKQATFEQVLIKGCPKGGFNRTPVTKCLYNLILTLLVKNLTEARLMVAYF